jgi:hypothetical protein
MRCMLSEVSVNVGCHSRFHVGKGRHMSGFKDCPTIVGRKDGGRLWQRLMSQRGPIYGSISSNAQGDGKVDGISG